MNITLTEAVKRSFIVTTITEIIYESYFQMLIFHIHSKRWSKAPGHFVQPFAASQLCSQTELCWLLDPERQNN